MKRKFTAVLLCAALILGVTPIVYAQDIIDNVIPATTNIDNLVQTEGEPYIIGELTEKRTEDTKHFLMSDRSIVAAMYNEVVHYDNNGAWVDIDNSFSTNDENEFENKSNSFKTKFSKKSNGNKLVTITKDNYSLSWMLEDVDKVNAQVSQSSEMEHEDISVLKNIQGTVNYPEIQNDVDLQYVISGTDVKENIILKSTDAPTEYTFTYKFNTLSYRTNENEQIEFYDNNNPDSIVFVIDTPYMYDSADAYSDNIEMQISKTNNGFKLTLIPNKDWLLSEDRVYPIVIDPTTLSQQKAKDSWDITLYNAWAAPYDYDRDEILVGSNTSSNIYRTLLKFYNLPNIGNGSIIVNAKMHIVPYYLTASTGVPSLLPRPTDDIQVNVHRINEVWPETNPTWSEHSDNYDAIIEDYFIYTNTAQYFSADITNLVNDWYNGSANYGVILKANDETASNHIMQFASSDFSTNGTIAAGNRPLLTVNYRVCIGLEDYWSYTTQDIGGYGTGYVNNYNGNLTYIHDDVSFNSLINGFTLSHIYNTANSNDSTGRYGKGWGLNLVQTFKPVTIENNTAVKFVYIDGDGTKHYFIQLDDGSIVDEDGLGYTYSLIAEGELIYKLTDKDKNILKFDQWGALRRIIDTNGNTINLNYSPVPNQFNYLSSITTSSGGTIQLIYDSEYKLTAIKDNVNRTTTYSYTSGKLTQITYPDNSYLRYSYDENNLNEIILPDGKKLCYSYYSDSKISSQKIKSANNNVTAQYSFNYFNNKTEVVDSANRKLIYLFDSFGRVTCIYDNDGNSYSTSYTPVSTTANEIFANNKLSISSNNVRYINNLITNPVFSERASYWTEYKEAPGQTQISVVSDQTYISSKSVKITSTASSIQALMQAPSTTAGKTYTLSANLKTQDIISENRGAGVEIVTSTPQGNKYYYSDFIVGTTDDEINNGFVTASVTAAMASNENIIRISVGLYNASGTVWIDSVQLEEGDTANKINLISNSSFESGLSSYNTDFGTSPQNGGGITNSVTFTNGGAYTMKFTGNPTTFRSARQTVNISGKAGDVFSYGGWAKANSIPKHSVGNIANFQMCVKVHYTDTSTEWFKSEFNPYTDEWQYTQSVFSPQKDYTKLELCFGYDYNCNNAYFDNIFLYRDIAQSYKYDSNGNVVSTADYAKQQSSFEYTNNNLTKLINPDGTSYEYTYDSKNNLTDAQSNVGVKYHIKYDDYGNPLTTETTSTNADFNKKITSSATYQNNGNYPHTVTDSRGNTTTYTYDTARGLQTGVTDAKGNITEYEYDSLNDRLDYVVSGGNMVEYYYNSIGQLTDIDSPSGTSYTLNYDEFGNTKTVYVGTQKLTENFYNTSRGLLNYSVYGNGQKIGYTYDILDRITEKRYNDVVKVKFRYDKFGNLYEKQDLFTNTTYRYNYDLSGRITGVFGNNNTSLNYIYDEFNRIEKYIAKLGSYTNSTEYIYGDSNITGQKNGLIYGVKQNGTQRIGYEYDALARLSKRTLNTTEPFEITYNYLTDNTNGTTSTVLSNMLVGYDYHNYFYDDVGNIVRYNVNGTNLGVYTYDALNQLKTETRANGDVYEYTYDNGGNIQSVKKNGSLVKGFTYDDTWTDLLTSYNGMSIVYDEIGNPTTYYDGSSLTWQNGRQLSSISFGVIDTVEYTYNSDGLRASKNVNGTITDYYWLEGVLIGQKTGNDYIIYLYDESGTPYGIICNNTYYYYIQNAQGDIIGILDADGNTVVEYTYSAWGETLSITGSLASTIGRQNPLRYRGYYYDTESGFYYLQSRYYDPVICRFINADGLVSTGQGILGYNMFAYCGNNPVNYVDPTGFSFVSFVKEIFDVVYKMVDLILSKYELKNNPTKLTYKDGDNISDVYANENDASVIARMLYGEDHRSAAAHLWVLENRRIAGNYGGDDFRSLILAKNQFVCMTGSRSLNPADTLDKLDEKEAWALCVDMAYLYSFRGIKAIPKPFPDFNYTYTHSYSDDFAKNNPNGYRIGDTWFYNKE